MKTILFITILVLISSISISQENQKLFIEGLINNNDNLEKYVDKDELAKSKRLGINYDGVKYKFIISYDIDEKIIDGIKKNGVKYDVSKSNLGNRYSVAEFTVPSLNYSKKFYFKNGKWISPITYYSKDWTTKESKYFIFKISEPKYFNDYCIKKLDEFVDSMAVLLEFDKKQRRLLEKEKIYYILCGDEKEIKQITVFDMRGQFITSMDEVITTYNTHYHELAHLLMNYKLKNPSLYTLPFFMEGFAVAVGGRGGIAKRVMLDIGYYLQRSGFLTHDSLITNNGFYSEDASLTYPVAGLYNAFLIKELEMDSYIKLYKSLNGTLADLEKIKRNQIDLPDAETIDSYFKEYESEPNIYVDKHDTIKSILGSRSFIKAGDFYKFSITTPFIISLDSSQVQKSYISKKYDEIIKRNKNEGGYNSSFIYGIAADSLSVSLYNFYTNEIIASYSVNFSMKPQPVPVINGRYEFFIRQSIFENDLDSIMIDGLGR
jgi:hypothetical protein